MKSNASCPACRPPLKAAYGRVFSGFAIFVALALFAASFALIYVASPNRYEPPPQPSEHPARERASFEQTEFIEYDEQGGVALRMEAGVLQVEEEKVEGKGVAGALTTEEGEVAFRSSEGVYFRGENRLHLRQAVLTTDDFKLTAGELWYNKEGKRFYGEQVKMEREGATMTAAYFKAEAPVKKMVFWGGTRTTVKETGGRRPT